jgi:hypothetical protein
MHQMNTSEDKWSQLEASALRCTAAALREVVCPYCGGALRFHFHDGVRAALLIACTSCKSRSSLDGIAATPLWVAEAGLTVITGQPNA